MRHSSCLTVNNIPISDLLLVVVRWQFWWGCVEGRAAECSSRFRQRTVRVAKKKFFARDACPNESESNVTYETRYNDHHFHYG